jgi:hypothetical protein
VEVTAAPAHQGVYIVDWSIGKSGLHVSLNQVARVHRLLVQGAFAHWLALITSVRRRNTNSLPVYLAQSLMVMYLGALKCLPSSCTGFCAGSQNAGSQIDPNTSTW